MLFISSCYSAGFYAVLWYDFKNRFLEINVLKYIPESVAATEVSFKASSQRRHYKKYQNEANSY